MSSPLPEQAPQLCCNQGQNQEVLKSFAKEPMAAVVRFAPDRQSIPLVTISGAALPGINAPIVYIECIAGRCVGII
jgi:hypothetical protein